MIVVMELTFVKNASKKTVTHYNFLSEGGENFDVCGNQPYPLERQVLRALDCLFWGKNFVNCFWWLYYGG